MLRDLAPVDDPRDGVRDDGYSGAPCESDPDVGTHGAFGKQILDGVDDRCHRKATADKIGDVFTDIGEARAAAAADPQNIDQEAMNTIATDLQAATDELDEVCGAV